MSVPPPGPEGFVLVGRMMHERLEGAKHRFEYPAFALVLDLDRLAARRRRFSLLGVNRWAPLSIWDRDYLDGKGGLRQKVDRHLAARGLAAARVLLVTVPRVFGRVFNPVSFYYCTDAQGGLVAALAEVNNTFHERHLYVLDRPREAKAPGTGTVEYRVPKDFHVSPFFDRQGDYAFSFSPPGPERLDIRVDLLRGDTVAFRSRLWGRTVPLQERALAGALLRRPFSAALAYPRILAQAARLAWGKRLSVHTKPYAASSQTLIPEPAGVWRGAQRDLVLRFFHRLRRGRLTLTLPDRSRQVFGGLEAGPEAEMTVGNWTFFRRLLGSGDIGLGESYQEGEWTSPDLTAVLRVFGANLDHADERRHPFLGAVGRLRNRLRHLRHANTPTGSRRNIAAHYDLSNDLYALFLDETWTYSCALFEDPTAAGEEDLASAQRRKMRALLEPLGLKPGQSLLEIGSGWGSLAISAARDYGVRVRSITLSREQLVLAQRRAEEAGVADRVRFELLDYRRVEGTYDAIVSCEMLEAVGHEHLGGYFAALDRTLKPGGRASVQVISMPDHRYGPYRLGVDWIQKHIFPGAVCPSLAALTAAMGRSSRLMVTSLRDIGPHYAATLRLWREAFLRRAQDARALGFDEKFLRTWDYYFSYCEAGFAGRLLGDLQLVLERSGEGAPLLEVKP